jgi:hypothetical protein
MLIVDRFDDGARRVEQPGDVTVDDGRAGHAGRRSWSRGHGR